MSEKCEKYTTVTVGAGTDTMREVRWRSPETYWEGNVRTRGKHSGWDLTGVGGNGVRTQVLTATTDEHLDWRTGEHSTKGMRMKGYIQDATGVPTRGA